MRTTTLMFLLMAAMTTSARAGAPTPGSVLVFPFHGSNSFFTVISVTNTNISPGTGTTNVHFDYVNVIPDPADPLHPLSCTRFDRIEVLTAADTLSVRTACHNPGAGGYLVVTAQDPAQFKTSWSFNHLAGSFLVVNQSGGMYFLDAIPFQSIPVEGTPTDLNGDGQLDFDGVEYEQLPDALIMNSFVPAAGSHLTLINLTGGPTATNTVLFDLWNDNEFSFSFSLEFSCWFDQPLADLSSLFTEQFLVNNTPNDPTELDMDCDNVGDLESGWARINSTKVVDFQGSQISTDGALLGAITAGPLSTVDGAHSLWHGVVTQNNGKF